MHFNFELKRIRAGDGRLLIKHLLHIQKTLGSIPSIGGRERGRNGN